MRLRKREEIERDEIAFFSGYYDELKYNLVGWDLRLKRELASLLRHARAKKLGRVLSLGCGDGHFERLLAPFAEQIVALDISPAAIELAANMAEREGISNIDFRCMPLSAVKFDEEYDVIICLAFLHHIPLSDFIPMLQAVYGHLREGGFFYSQDPNMHGILRKVGRILLKKSYTQYHSPDERELDPEELRQILIGEGFSRVQIGYIDFTLIPVLFMLAKGPSWPLYLCRAMDWILCHSPFARSASGFTCCAFKS
jgi:2-polyprenyl-3-methyl-5-hydroxy-6-metoxy-1,4-benzoquinol methylase